MKWSYYIVEDCVSDYPLRLFTYESCKTISSKHKQITILHAPDVSFLK